jgi:enamine deaminase RidA (YjgF/YER057c/UK114 family)
MAGEWQWPIGRADRVAAMADWLTFVGGAGDFDENGRIRHPGDQDAQIGGALTNLAAALAVEGCSLADVVRLKAFYPSDGTRDEWPVAGGLLQFLRRRSTAGAHAPAGPAAALCRGRCRP